MESRSSAPIKIAWELSWEKETWNAFHRSSWRLRRVHSPLSMLESPHQLRTYRRLLRCSAISVPSALLYLSFNSSASWSPGIVSLSFWIACGRFLSTSDTIWSSCTSWMKGLQDGAHSNPPETFTTWTRRYGVWHIRQVALVRSSSWPRRRGGLIASCSHVLAIWFVC